MQMMRRLYVEEKLSFRAVGKRMSMSHERVRQLLLAEGVVPRARGRMAR